MVVVVVVMGFGGIVGVADNSESDSDGDDES